MDIDVSQLSKWKGEENWDEKLEEIQEQVQERMGLSRLEKDQEIDVAEIEAKQHIARLREMMIAGLKAFEDGDIAFEKVSELRAFMKDYFDAIRLIQGEPTERKATDINISLGGKGGDPLQAIRALLAIAGTIEEDKNVIDVTPED